MVGTSNQSDPEMAIENMMNLRDDDKLNHLNLFFSSKSRESPFSAFAFAQNLATNEDLLGSWIN